MSSVTRVYVNVDRQESVRRGVNGTETPVMIDVDVVKLTDEDREEFARRLAVAPTDGMYHQPGPRLRAMSRDDDRCCSTAPITVGEPSLKGVLETFAADRSHRQEQDAIRRETEEKKVKEMRAKMDAWLATPDEEIVTAQGQGSCYWPSDDRIGKYRGYVWQAPFPRDNSYRAEEFAEKQRRLDAEKERRNTEEVARIIAERGVAAQEKKNWIAQHGSRRLITMLAEGIQCEQTYQSERERYDGEKFAARLAEQRPGWSIVKESEIDRDIRDVSDRALSILAAGRQVAKSCKLAKRGKKYVCVDEFYGRLIVWPGE